MKIILASGSPRRREILKLLGLDFEVEESGFPEEDVEIDDPAELVEELAIQKAYRVANKHKGEDLLVVGGDTVVAVNMGEGEMMVMSKLKSADEAREIIKILSGKVHKVYSGVAVVDCRTMEAESLVGDSGVRFLDLSEEVIDKYIESEGWRGYAGGYALQGEAAHMIEGYEGSLSTIIGLPIEELVELLESRGMVIDIDYKSLEEEMKDMRIGIED